MTRLMGALTVSILTATAFLAADEKKDAKVQSTKAIMILCFDDEQGLSEVIGTLVKAKEPKWDSIGEKTKVWVKAAEDLRKNKPNKGTAESWATLTKKWLDDATALDTAAGKKDAKAVTASLKTLGTSCKGCHPAHK